MLGWGEIGKVRPIWKELIESLEINLSIDGIVAEEATEAPRYTENGRSTKSFQGSGPTGRRYELTAMAWFEMRGDRIYRRWGARDSASQYRQLGFTQ